MPNRKRTFGINIRVTETEKKYILRRAEKCRLTASEYLRKLASGYEPKVFPPVDFFTLTEQLNAIYRELQTHYSPELEQRLLALMLQLQEEFLLPKKRGDAA